MIEQEIKLHVQNNDELDFTTLTGIEAIEDAEVEQLHLVSHYFDSPDLILFKSGLGLRRRFNGLNWLQTLKDNGVVKDGLHQRNEWEHPLERDAFDVNLLLQTPLNTIINDEAVWSTVEKIFTTDFIRYTWQLVLPDQTEVEMAYDRGQVYRGEQNSSIHELELELKSGNIEQLRLLAEQLMNSLPVEASDISKAQRGYQLLGLS